MTQSRASPDRKEGHDAFRILTVGISDTAVCGVRDYNDMISDAFDRRGCRVEALWWHRDEKWGPLETRARAREWLSSVRRTAANFGPQVILWQYSAFAYGNRGIPHLVPAAARTLGSIGAPVVALLHEFAYPISGRGWQGIVHAATTRAVLPVLFRHCAGVVVTTEERERLAQASWLPARPVLFVPVFSNLEPRDDVLVPHREPRRIIGVYGFRSDESRPAPLIEALRELRRRGHDLELRLIGAPGNRTPQASEWREVAAEAGCQDALQFTGILDKTSLAAALTAVDVAVLPRTGGPESRHGTLATWLAFGLPLVAFEGPHLWKRFVDERALRVVPPSGTALADALALLLADPVVYSAQARRSRSFYLRHMSQEVVADRLLCFFADLGRGRPYPRRSVSKSA